MKGSGGDRAGSKGEATGSYPLIFLLPKLPCLANRLISGITSGRNLAIRGRKGVTACRPSSDLTVGPVKDTLFRELFSRK